MIKRDPVLQEFLDGFAANSGIIPQAEAEAARVCGFCRKPVGSFTDALSRKEYGISGMCQTCQDGFFDC